MSHSTAAMVTLAASETSLTSSSSSSSSTKSNASLPADLLAGSDNDVAKGDFPSSELPAPDNSNNGNGSRRGSSFLMGRASVAGTGLSKSDPSFDVFVPPREPPTKVNFTVGKQRQQTPSRTANLLTPESAIPRIHHHHHQRKHPGSWKKKLSAVGTMLQGQIVRDKAWCVVQLTESLQGLTQSMAEACKMGYGDEVGGECEQREQQFADTNVRIREEVNDIFEHLQMALRERVSSKKLQYLRQLRARSDPGLDISASFFGTDWSAMEQRLTAVMRHANAVSDQLMASNGRGKSSSESDAALLESSARLVAALSAVQQNLVLHAEAVLRGRINRQQNDIMREQQQSTNREFLATLRKRRESLAAEKALKTMRGGRGPLGKLMQRLSLQRGSSAAPASALSKEDLRRLRLVAAARSASQPSPRPSATRRAAGRTSLTGGGNASSRRPSARTAVAERRSGSSGVRLQLPPSTPQQRRIRSKSCVPGEIDGVWRQTMTTRFAGQENQPVAGRTLQPPQQVRFQRLEIE